MIRALILYTAVTSGLSAGIFYAFSSFVMKALGDLPPAQGVAAMNSINRQAPTPLFMIVLMGTSLTGTFLGGYGLLNLGKPGSALLVAGAAAYLTAILLTGVYHVPRNDRLMSLDPGTAAAAAYWKTYLSQWTAWNHLRVAGPLAAAVAFTLAWRQSG
ncbi:DUF1772 domain-containing protein [Actinocorallia longicatena]|uniref:DUF1772 domain-containing protein n=1 Tax=Actinocorallia longicatena TaxID=111803 RepID=A0ABP6Q820_9ACTN